MADNGFDEIENILKKFNELGTMGSARGWLALREYTAQAERQIQFAEVATQAMAARRRVLDGAVQTITAEVEAAASFRRLAEKRAQLMLPQSAQAQLPAAPPPARPSALEPPLSAYISDQAIQDAALQAAIGYGSAPDKEKYWKDVESRLTAKKWPEATIAEVRQVATEVIRRTGG